ncbi:hypothetical protein [Nocardia pseudovaccinii]|uniref:hypothetical protein n=1 Tax=Nocardia pseudovaccinii TaxID=189540 RepID=UPI0007A48D77|nr:hypothetical protein [Nocardia pseudovaccinii]
MSAITADVLHEENERLQPYGPPPSQVDPGIWTELTGAVYRGQWMLGLSLHHWQVRDLAAYIADQMFAGAPATREVSSR